MKEEVVFFIENDGQSLVIIQISDNPERRLFRLHKTEGLAESYRIVYSEFPDAIELERIDGGDTRQT